MVLLPFYLDLFGDINSHFHMLDCNFVLHKKKNCDIHVNASITVGVIGGISFYVMVENWSYLKYTLAFSLCFVCQSGNRGLLISDVLPSSCQCFALIIYRLHD